MPCDTRLRKGIATRNLEGFLGDHLEDQDQIELALQALARLRSQAGLAPEPTLAAALLEGPPEEADYEQAVKALRSLRRQTAERVAEDRAQGVVTDWRDVAEPEAARRVLAAVLALRAPERYRELAGEDPTLPADPLVGRLVAESLRYASRGEAAEYAWQVEAATEAADRLSPPANDEHRHDGEELREELLEGEQQTASPLLPDLDALQRAPELVPVRREPEHELS